MALRPASILSAHREPSGIATAATVMGAERAYGGISFCTGCCYGTSQARVKPMLDATGTGVLICFRMVCCVIGAFILGMIFRGARWTGRSVRKIFAGNRPPAPEPERIVPKPVYEMPAYVTSESSVDERTPELV